MVMVIVIVIVIATSSTHEESFAHRAAVGHPSLHLGACLAQLQQAHPAQKADG